MQRRLPWGAHTRELTESHRPAGQGQEMASWGTRSCSGPPVTPDSALPSPGSLRTTPLACPRPATLHVLEVNAPLSCIHNESLERGCSDVLSPSFFSLSPSSFLILLLKVFIEYVMCATTGVPVINRIHKNMCPHRSARFSQGNQSDKYVM